MKNYNLTLSWSVFKNNELEKSDRMLVEAAKKATDGSYSPYSEFRVGAALLLDDGTVVTGSNQENAAYPSGLCAERTALFAAGHNYPGKVVIAIAIAARNTDGWTEKPISPCGACRQVMAETEALSGRPIRTILYGEEETMIIPDGTAMLLPFCFETESMA